MAEKAPAKRTAKAPTKSTPAKRAPAKRAVAEKPAAKVAVATAPAAQTEPKGDDKGSDVKALQRFLDVAVDGVLGPATGKAVKRWQKARGHQPTGEVTERQWREIKAAL